MIHIDVIQGSREWLDAKVGIPSASNFHRILTPKTLKFSASADDYRNELLAERLAGMPLDKATSQFMQRGTDTEQAARRWYAFQRDVEVEQVGFCLTDDGRVGCSPDGLIGDDGGLEIKCLSAKEHIGLLVDGVDAEFRCQIQGGMWVTGRSWWDLVAFNPGMPSLLLHFERDEEFLKALQPAVARFLSMLDEARLKLRADYGLFADDRIPDLKIA